MLYVSRIVPGRGVGVVDTDDGVESFVSLDLISETVNKYGIEIKGFPRGGTSYQAFVWQDPASMSALQVKFKVLYDTEIVVYKDELVGVHVGVNAPASVKIVVSEFASKISGAMQAWWDKDARSKSQAVLVLDDTVEMTTGVVPVGLYNIKVDISDISDQGVVKKIYYKLIDAIDGEFSAWDSYIADNRKRRDLWFCAGAMSAWIDESDIAAVAESYDFKGMSKELFNMFKDEFQDILELKLTIKDVAHLRRSVYSRALFNSMRNKALFTSARDSNDFNKLRASFLSFIEHLHILDKVDVFAVHRFCNFLRLCNYSEKFKSAYVGLCNNIARDVLNALSVL